MQDKVTYSYMVECSKCGTLRTFDALKLLTAAQVQAIGATPAGCPMCELKKIVGGGE